MSPSIRRVYRSEHHAFMHQPGECISRRLADEVVRVSGVSGVVQIRDGDVDAGALLNGLQQRGIQLESR